MTSEKICCHMRSKHNAAFDLYKYRVEKILLRKDIEMKNHFPANTSRPIINIGQV